MSVFEIDLIHVVGIGISLALFYQSIRLVRNRKESVIEFLLWVSFGIIIILLSLGSSITAIDMLDLLESLIRIVGIQSGLNGVLTLAILSILLVLFYTFINTKTNQERITDLSQEIALVEYQLEQTHSESSSDGDDSESANDYTQGYK